MNRQNPTDGLNQLDREHIKWVSLKRPCDDPATAFARNRTVKLKAPPAGYHTTLNVHGSPNGGANTEGLRKDL